MKKLHRDNKGIALLTVIMVMIIGLVLAALCFYLIGQGNKTYRMSKNYAKAFNIAQGGVEEAILLLEDNEKCIDYRFGVKPLLLSTCPLRNCPDNPENCSLGDKMIAISGAEYWIWFVFSKQLAGFGGAPVFPPVSGAYDGGSTGYYFLIHSTATEGNAQADLYVMYLK